MTVPYSVFGLENNIKEARISTLQKIIKLGFGGHLITNQPITPTIFIIPSEKWIMATRHFLVINGMGNAPF